MPVRDDRDDTGGGVVMALQRVAVAEVRREVTELRDDTGRIERHVDTLDQQLDEMQDDISNLRERQARTEGELTHLSRAYERTAALSETQVLTELEVKKADALARIRDRELEHKHRRAVRRELIFKAIAFAMGVGTLVSAMIRARC